MLTQNYLAGILGCALLLLSPISGAWVIDQNYDADAVGVKCVPFFINGADSYISSERSLSGSNSCKMEVTKGEFGWGGGFVLPQFLAEGDSIWVRFRLFIPIGFDYNAYSAGNNLKFIRMTLRDPTSKIGRMDWLWTQEGDVPPYVEGLERDLCTTNCNFRFGAAGDKPARGVWETYEMYVKWDQTAVDDGGTGRIRMWKNGKLIGERTDRPTMWPGSTEIVSVLLFSYWNGGAPATQHLYMEDLIATDVTPTATDAAGNPFIGPGGFVFIAPPEPPGGIEFK